MKKIAAAADAATRAATVRAEAAEAEARRLRVSAFVEYVDSSLLFILRCPECCRVGR